MLKLNVTHDIAVYISLNSFQFFNFFFRTQRGSPHDGPEASGCKSEGLRLSVQVKACTLATLRVCIHIDMRERERESARARATERVVEPDEVLVCVRTHARACGPGAPLPGRDAGLFMV